MNINLFKKKDILVACSGGADSICLLHCLYEKLVDGSIRSLFCASFDHKLRIESKSEQNFVKEFCQNRGIRFFAGSSDVGLISKTNGTSIEQTARNERYKFLQTIAEKYRLTIATAHNAEDNLETVLLNLTRGSGTLHGIPPERDNIIRPLLYASRAEIESYLSERNINFVNDPSNQTDIYSRNRVRHHVTPVLAKINQNVCQNVLRTCELTLLDQQFLNEYAATFINGNSINVNVLQNLHFSISSRIIRILSGCSLSMVNVKQILKMCDKNNGNNMINLPNQTVALREYDFLRIITGAEYEQMQNSIEISDKINKTFKSVIVNADTIKGEIVWRTRMTGDTLKMFNCTKTVKKWMIERKIPIELRNKIPIAADDDGIIFVQGLGINQQRLPNKTCKKIDILKNCDF